MRPIPSTTYLNFPIQVQINIKYAQQMLEILKEIKMQKSLINLYKSLLLTKSKLFSCIFSQIIRSSLKFYLQTHKPFISLKTSWMDCKIQLFQKRFNYSTLRRNFRTISSTFNRCLYNCPNMFTSNAWNKVKLKPKKILISMKFNYSKRIFVNSWLNNFKIDRNFHAIMPIKHRDCRDLLINWFLPIFILWEILTRYQKKIP